MIQLPRLKLIGEDSELTRIESALQSSGAVFSRHIDLDEACDQQEVEGVDIFVIGPSLYFQGHLQQIQKLKSSPGVLLASGEKLPNLAKIIVPHIAFVDGSNEEILWSIRQCAESQRRKKRLDILRDHHKRSVSTETNPAINLITNLMRKCTVAEDYPDLLAATLTLKSAIDFQDCALVTLDSSGKILDAWRCPMESKDRILKIDVREGSDLEIPLEDGEVQVLNPQAALPHGLTDHPWSTALTLKFSSVQAPRKKNVARSAVLFFFRRELFPFLERDNWLLELTCGPLSLALEKVAMFKTISQASKEWRSTFDGISEPLTVIDSTFQIVKANKAFAQLVDLDIKKLKGRRCYSLLANRRSPCIGCPVNFEQQPQGGTRLQLMGKDKKDLLVWSYGIRTGLDSYFFQFYRNVSKETALTAALIQSEKMAALGRLVGAVAHEINNPLAGILATSQILLQEKSYPEAIRDDLEEIRSAAWRSKKIIDDLLGFTSSEERKFENISPLEIIKSALTFSKAAMQDVRVSIQSPENIPEVFVSVSALQQILFNLVTNAVHAMNGKGNLTISVEPAGTDVSIKITDSGPGIPAEKLSHIFDPFYTSKQEGTGTGLGLSIVRSLIQKIQSRIEVSSEAGKGTEFRLFIPTKANNG